MTFYQGKVFPQWNGSLLISGLASRTLSRVVFDNEGNARPGERWGVGFQVRDVAVAPDGAVWLIENSATGGLYRVMPK
jgi:glucose/arabinose dehydrogenase